MFTQPSTNQIASTYAGNPAPLARKVDQDKKQNGGIPKDLRQLMALNDIAEGKQAVGINQALQIPVNMPTVAQNMQQLAQQALQSRLMAQAREQQRLQQKPPILPDGTPQPKDQPQGIDALSTNVGDGYAEGGIIGDVRHFTKGGATSQAGDLFRSLVDAISGGIEKTAEYGKLKSEREEAVPGFFEALTPEERAARQKKAALLSTQLNQVGEEGGVKTPYPEAGKPTYDRPVGQADFDREYRKIVRQTPAVREAEAAAASTQKTPAAATNTTRVNAPESSGIVDALPAATQTEAYKKLAEMMNQDPEVKARALRDRYMKEVGQRDMSAYDRTLAELEARKEKLQKQAAPKAGFEGLMDYLGNIAESGGKTWYEAGSKGSALQQKKRLALEEQQNALMDKILELGGKKSDALFAEKKGMFDMTQKERDDIFTKAFDAAKSVNASDDKAKELAAQAVQKELDRKAQIRAASIGAQDRDNLMSRARALMAVDKTLTLEKAMEKAATIAATGQLGAAEMRANTAGDQVRAKIREKYAWVDMLPANDPTGIAMRKERDKALAAVGGGAGLPDAVTSAGGPTSSNVRSQADAIISGGR